MLIMRLGTYRLEDIWWIDLSWMPGAVSAALSILTALTLISFAVLPKMSAPRKWLLITLSSIYALLELYSSLSYYKAIFDGHITSTLYIPFSLLLLIFFIALIIHSYFHAEVGDTKSELAYMIICSLLWIPLFPLAQVTFFGSTDYTRQADAAVIFGARYYPDGRLSLALKDRMDKGIKLYKQEKVDYLILSGGVDRDGIDETVGMVNYAQENGIPAAALIVDNKGSNTDLSVANTVAIAKERGFEKMLAVSHGYHLPRIKMAYRAARYNIYTVPSPSTVPKSKDKALSAREIPGFWAYYFRSALRDLSTKIMQ